MAISCSNTIYWLIHLFLHWFKCYPFHIQTSHLYLGRFGLLVCPMFWPLMWQYHSFKCCPFAIYLSIWWGWYMDIALLFQNFPQDTVAIDVPFCPVVTFIFMFQDPCVGSSTPFLPFHLFSHCTFYFILGFTFSFLSPLLEGEFHEERGMYPWGIHLKNQN